MNYKAYQELAWTDCIIANPDEYHQEVEYYLTLLKQHGIADSFSMLHLGCGAGGHDVWFKKHTQITGVDVSEGMLTLAKLSNPEATYLLEDMRYLELDSTFDVIIIPDSIMYMSTIKDVELVLKTIKKHLKPHGVFLITTFCSDFYSNNNFIYTNTKDDVSVTIFENNYRISESLVEATLVYLIRKDNQTSIEHEIHTLGLFSVYQWKNLFEKHQFNITISQLDHLYDSYIQDENEYSLTVFVGTLKSLNQ